MGAVLPRDLRHQVEELLREGLSNVEVHRRTGVARGTVARYRQRFGLPGYRVSEDSPACRVGHPFPENKARNGDGWLYCVACSRERARLRAARSYVPVEPDLVAVERAVAGDPPERLTPRERRAAIDRLDALGLPASVISGRVRCSKRTVYRVRSAAG